MDNIIISGVRIYFPKSHENLPEPPEDMPNFAVRSTETGSCYLMEYLRNIWSTPALPLYAHLGNATMAAVRRPNHQ